MNEDNIQNLINQALSCTVSSKVELDDDQLDALQNLNEWCVNAALQTPEVAKKLITAYGTDRVLFGTDYPMWSPTKELDTFFELGFSDEDNKKILSENAIKVFNID